MFLVFDYRLRLLYEVLMEIFIVNVIDLDSRCGMFFWLVFRVLLVFSEIKFKDKLLIVRLIIRKIIEEFYIIINRNYVIVMLCCL